MVVKKKVVNKKGTKKQVEPESFLNKVKGKLSNIFSAKKVDSKFMKEAYIEKEERERGELWAKELAKKMKATVKLSKKNDHSPIKSEALLNMLEDLQTEKKKAKSLQKKFEAIFDNVTVGIITVDAKTKKFIMVNDQICKMLGYTEAELLKLDVSKIHPKKDLPNVIDAFEKQVKGEIKIAPSLPVLRKDRKVIYCDITATSQKIGGKEVMLGMFNDVTEKRSAKRKLEQKEKTLNEAQRIAHMGSWNWNVLTNEVTWSDELYKLFNVKKGSIKLSFEAYLKMIHPSYKKKVQTEVMGALKTGSFSHDIKIILKSGKERYHHVEGKTHYKGKKPVRMAGISFDITERKKAEEKYKSLIMSIPGMVYKGNPDWTTEIVSNCESITGYTIEELKSRKINWFDLIHPDDKTNVLEGSKKIETKPTQIIQRYRIIDKNKKVLLVEDNKVSKFSGTKFAGVDGIVFDITEKKKSEEKLKLNNELFKNISEGIYLIGLKDFKIKYANHKFEEIFCYNPG